MKKFPLLMRRSSLLGCLLVAPVAVITAVAQDGVEPVTIDDGEIAAVPPAVTAQATIRTCETWPRRVGHAFLRERPSNEGIKQVDIHLRIRRPGIAPGKHAVHIHQMAVCDPCSGAGGHFDPGPHGHTSPDGNHPFHSGDLTNIELDENGKGSLLTQTTRITLSEGPLSLFDADGSAFIVHYDPDTYCPEGEDAGCAGGARAACGIIELDP